MNEKKTYTPPRLRRLVDVESCARACADVAKTVTGMSDYERGMRDAAAACERAVRGTER